MSGSHSENAEAKRRAKSQSMSSSNLDPRTVLLMDPRADLLPQLLDFDEAQRQRVFDSKVFSCGICFAEKLGINCLCFKECQHVFCNACMTEYFQIQIRDGNVQCLNCPELKCTSLATPMQVRQQYHRDTVSATDCDFKATLQKTMFSQQCLLLNY